MILGCSMVSPKSDIMKTNFRFNLAINDHPKFIQIEGVNLAYYDLEPQSGKPLVICLHAIGHGSRDFEYFILNLNKYYRIILIDWPGQGRSETDKAKVSIERYTRLLESFVEKLNFDSFALIGNSIGGGVALKYSSLHQQKVRGLILANPAGLDEGGLLARLFIWYIERKMALGSKADPDFVLWFKRYYENILVTKDSFHERERIINSAYEIAPILEQAWASFRQPENDLRSTADLLDIPILFTWAKLDKYVQLERSLPAIKKFKNAKLIEFNSGHSPFLENPLEFNAQAEQFLKSIF